MNPLLAARDLGHAFWLDNLSRDLLASGELATLIRDDGIQGLTSNPAIFEQAFSHSPRYQPDIAALMAQDMSPETRLEHILVSDIRAACDLFTPVYLATAGDQGYVSLEVSPHLAHDTEGTVATAQRLFAEVGRPNLMIKVPGTAAGNRALETLIALGINVNVTLLFNLSQTLGTFEAYLRGLHRLANNGSPAHVRAVASVFMSRVDTAVDNQLDSQGSPLPRGRAALAMARLAWQRWLEIFEGPAFDALAEVGSRPQSLLWASTGSKNPAFSDVMYVEELIGPASINTLPTATLAAFRAHGRAERRIDTDPMQAQADYLALEAAGIDFETLGETLQTQGLVLFETAYDKLLDRFRDGD
jgi:transaldolase